MKRTIISILVYAGLACSLVLTGCQTTEKAPEPAPVVDELPTTEELTARLDQAIEKQAAEEAGTTRAAFQTTANDTGVTITKYAGTGGVVTIPGAISGVPVTSISRDAFTGHTRINEIVVEADNPSYSSIEGALFDKAGATLIRYPDGKAATSYSVPARVQTIEDNAFYGSTKLTTVSIPAGVTSIGNEAFAGCTGLTEIQVDAENERYTSIEGSLFNKEGTVLIRYPSGKTDTRFNAPYGVVDIKSGAFGDSAHLSSIGISETVTSIGANAFFGCTGLTEIAVSENNPMYRSVDGVMLNKAGNTLVCYPGGRDGEYSIPSGVTSIRGGTFYGSIRLSAIVIPEGVTNIGDGVFVGCSALKTVTIPSGITRIGEWAFAGCKNLETIVLPYGLVSIGGGALYGCTSLKEIILPSGLTAIGEWAFAGCRSLGTITIPPGVKSVPKWSFANCSGLREVTLAAGVIDEWAFYACTGLSSVTIPDGMSEIRDRAFRNCTGLKEVVIPYGVTLGREVFRGCSGLDQIVRADVAQRFGESVF
jgi:hypothetical protein